MPVPVSPGPQFGPSPLEPTPPELQTPSCTPPPRELGSTVGVAPWATPKMSPPPKELPDRPSMTVSGWPLATRTTPAVYQPPMILLNHSWEELPNRCP